jgi:hypothetical protein
MGNNFSSVSTIFALYFGTVQQCCILCFLCWFFLLSNKVEHVEIVSKNVISTFEKYLKKYYDGEIEISAFLTYSS